MNLPIFTTCNMIKELKETLEILDNMRRMGICLLDLY